MMNLLAMLKAKEARPTQQFLLKLEKSNITKRAKRKGKKLQEVSILSIWKEKKVLKQKQSA